MKLNQQTKLMYMTEHLLAIEDLIKDNIDEAFKEHVIEVVAGLLKSSDLAIPDSEVASSSTH